MSKKRPIRQRNGIAKALSSRSFQQRVLPNKKRKKDKNKLTTEETYEEGELDETIVLNGEDPKSNVHAFTVHNNLSKGLGLTPGTDPSVAEMVRMGFEVFEKELGKEATGFLSIIFEADGAPRIIWAGKMDLVRSLGALVIAEDEILKAFGES